MKSFILVAVIVVVSIATSIADTGAKSPQTKVETVKSIHEFR